MTERTPFKCMRCGHLFEQDYDPKAPLAEWNCPRPECKSNSIRPLPRKQET
jgi:DNA-directed RNA polymerase subunit RPC12/RpoP